MDDAGPRALVLAVDIGGGSVKLALTTRQAKTIGTRVVEGVSALDRETLLEEIGRSAESLIASASSDRVVGAAIGVPGFLSPDRRASLNSNVPVLDGFDLVGHFERRFGFGVRIENDANLAALGEWSFGPFPTASRFMMVTLGTGIGVALLQGGAPVGVMGGTLGDAGHIVVDPAASRSCRLGCRGCLESVASGVAIVEMAEGLADRDPASALGKLRRRGQPISGAEIARLAGAGDEPSLALLAQVGRWLGMGIASYINAFVPDVIGIGGGVSRFRPYFEDVLRMSVEAGRIKNRTGVPEIYFSEDFEAAAARGAVTLLEREGAWHGEPISR